MATADLRDLDLLDPNPDIWELFLYYNSLYFNRALASSCIVAWSSALKSCASTCECLPGGWCEILLSEPVFRYRSTADLKRTLLHEMVHAFLWVDDKSKNHRCMRCLYINHGPKFQSIMKLINAATITDLQRPSGGYKITTSHDFQSEVDKLKCESGRNLGNRAMKREPSANGSIGSMGHVVSYSNYTSYSHRHKMLCSDTYMKIAKFPAHNGRRTMTEGVQHLYEETSNPDIKKRPYPQGTENKPDLKKMRIMVTYPDNHCPRTTVPRRGKTLMGSKTERKETLRHKELCPTLSMGSCKKGVHQLIKGDTSEAVSNMTELANKRSCAEGVEDNLVVKRVRTAATILHNSEVVDDGNSYRERTEHLKRQEQYPTISSNNSSMKACKCKVYNVIIPWLGVYITDDDEEEEEMEPLINKRTERRKREWLLEELKRNAEDDEPMIDINYEEENF